MQWRCRHVIVASFLVIPAADSFCPAVGRPHTFPTSLSQHGVPEAISGWRRSIVCHRRAGTRGIATAATKGMPLRMQDGPGFDRGGAGELLLGVDISIVEIFCGPPWKTQKILSNMIFCLCRLVAPLVCTSRLYHIYTSKYTSNLCVVKRVL